MSTKSAVFRMNTADLLKVSQLQRNVLPYFSDSTFLSGYIQSQLNEQDFSFVILKQFFHELLESFLF